MLNSTSTNPNQFVFHFIKILPQHYLASVSYTVVRTDLSISPKMTKRFSRDRLINLKASLKSETGRTKSHKKLLYSANLLLLYICIEVHLPFEKIHQLKKMLVRNPIPSGKQASLFFNLFQAIQAKRVPTQNFSSTNIQQSLFCFRQPCSSNKVKLSLNI